MALNPIIEHFPQMREEMKDTTRENAAVMGATALAFIYSNPALDYVFFLRYGFTPAQVKAAMIVLSAIGKVDEQ